MKMAALEYILLFVLSEPLKLGLTDYLLICLVNRLHFAFSFLFPFV